MVSFRTKGTVLVLLLLAVVVVWKETLLLSVEETKETAAIATRMQNFLIMVDAEITMI